VIPVTVLHVFSGDLWAGAEVMIFNLLRELRVCGDLRVVALALNDGTLARQLRSVDVETHVIPEGGRSFAAIVAKGVQLARQIRADVIHSHRYKENMLAWVLARCTAARGLISTLHGLPEATSGAWDGGVRALVRRADLQLVKRGFDVAVAVSHDMRRILVESHSFPEERVRVIHNGVGVPVGEPSRQERSGRELHVGTVGRLVPVKGLDLFVEAAGLVAREGSGTQFSILGDGPLRERLLALVRARGAESCLRVLPSVADPAPFYRSLDLYVSTSLHEGLPLSVVEAMAYGTPVVAARVGGIPEVVTHGEHGFLVDGRDPAAFAARILQLAQDEGLRRDMGARAALRARSCFSASRMGERYGALYRQCMGQAAGAPNMVREEGRLGCG
jgi:glycosyltransferase involved in cell wall biosynthesis